MRVLILSPGHPEFVAGGTERASYSLFCRMKLDPRVSATCFVARSDRSLNSHGTALESFRGRCDELLAFPPPVDHFSLQTTGLDLLHEMVVDLISTFNPDVVHIHHVYGWGLEIIELFAAKKVPIVFTVHEFSLVCFNSGQMVKTSGELCYFSSPADCARCFPNFSSGKFFIRNQLIQSIISHIHTIIAPSKFLAGRLVEWGVSSKRIKIVDNVLDVATRRPRRRPCYRSRVVFGYFGQITPYKGVDILLRAYDLLEETIRKKLTVRIHGENKHYIETNFGRKLDSLFNKLESVERIGSYTHRDVVYHMTECDWIVVPSIWWENSPMVIHEARASGRPLILSEIGGLAEKAIPSWDLVVPPGRPSTLADLMRHIVIDRPKFAKPEADFEPQRKFAYERHVRVLKEASSSRVV